MEELKLSLARPLADNREMLRQSERRLKKEGDPEGNRHARRLAAKRAAQKKGRVRVTI